MENINFRTFQKFSDEALLIEATEILKAHNIDFEVENTSATFDTTFSNSQIYPEFIIKLLPNDFEKAHQILDQATKIEIEQVEKDYYLFSFSDEELFEVISKPDEWSRFDFLLAQKIMKNRGKEITPYTLELLKNQRLKDLTQPEPSFKAWIIAGYVFALTGGILGIFIAYNLISTKKTLPNGEQVFMYSADDRRQGWIILIIGTIVLVAICIWQFFDTWNSLN